LPLSEIDSDHLRRAIALAAATAAQGNTPFGAVLVSCEGVVLGEGANTVNVSGDVTAHAECAALRTAGTEHGLAALSGATIYSSGEPCAMCCTALVMAGVRRVVFGLPYAAARPHLPPSVNRVSLGARQVLGAAESPVLVEGPALEDEVHAVVVAAAKRP
jgi:tRNA(Arg) A34 adenosine deaminase TadA